MTRIGSGFWKHWGRFAPKQAGIHKRVINGSVLTFDTIIGVGIPQKYSFASFYGQPEIL